MIDVYVYMYVCVYFSNTLDQRRAGFRVGTTACI
jgi:hypothetical protein